MLEIDNDECLDLYFLLSNDDNLSECLDRLLIKIEAQLFNKYTVMELESLRLKFENKGTF